MSMELKPCPNPWCDRSGPPSAIPEGSSAEPWNVICVGCGFIGPAAKTEADAGRLWNLRTNSQDALIAELARALETCLAMGERQLKKGMNLGGQSPYEVGLAALKKARATLAKVHPHVG
jgi:hypothetical protein